MRGIGGLHWEGSIWAELEMDDGVSPGISAKPERQQSEALRCQSVPGAVRSQCAQGGVMARKEMWLTPLRAS